MLVTLDEAKSYMGVETTDHDVEILRLCSAATGVVRAHAWATPEQDTFTETVPRGTTTLRNSPVVSVATDGVEILDPEVGAIRSYGGEVTYVAGLDAVPDEYVDAALVYISYKYRRNHGGSESYAPAGIDGSIAPPMGTAALSQQIRLALGSYAAPGWA